MTTLEMMDVGLFWVVSGGSTSQTLFDLWSLAFQSYFITLNICRVMAIVRNKFEVWTFSLRPGLKQCCTSTSCESWPRSPPHEEPFPISNLWWPSFWKEEVPIHISIWSKCLSVSQRDGRLNDEIEQKKTDWWSYYQTRNRNGAALVNALEKSAVHRWPNADDVLQRKHFTFIKC